MSARNTARAFFCFFFFLKNIDPTTSRRYIRAATIVFFFFFLEPLNLTDVFFSLLFILFSFYN